MPKTLTTRALGAGFAAALVLGGAACGDDDDDVNVEEDVEDIGDELDQQTDDLGEDVEGED